MIDYQCIVGRESHPRRTARSRPQPSEVGNDVQREAMCTPNTAVISVYFSIGAVLKVVKRESLKGLTYQDRGDIRIIINMAQKKSRYVGLIMPVPFGRGYIFCPWLWSGIDYSAAPWTKPSIFKSKESALKWINNWAIWNPKRRYTLFNGLIAWVAYFPHLYYFLKHWRTHSLFLKVMLVVIFMVIHKRVGDTSIEAVAIVCLIVTCISAIVDGVIYLNEMLSGRFEI